ncbi:MAG TPA: hypothetical protein DHU79_06045, partial [Clostridiales bacterium]|nr:hypothetical protein [Clostridiales bacterium]
RDLRLTKAVRYLLCHISDCFVAPSFNVLNHYILFFARCQQYACNLTTTKLFFVCGCFDSDSYVLTTTDWQASCLAN